MIIAIGGTFMNKSNAGWLASLKRLFSSPRIGAVFVLGFSSGLPLLLTGGTLQAWMKTAGVDLGTIGMFSLVGVPYTLKFLWAPIMDRYIPPFMGRRRGWMMICQVALVITIAALAFSNPGGNAPLVALISLFVAFFSASQDVVVDAYCAEILKPEEMGFGSSAYANGYKIAMAVSGGVAILLADHLSWQQVYLIMAGVMSLGIVAAYFSPEPEIRAAMPASMTEAYITPLMEFFRRSGSIEILVFIVVYKLADVMANALVTPFLIELGFSLTAIGAVLKGVGWIAGISGGLLGGIIMVRMGIRQALLVFGVLQAVSALLYMLLAVVGQNYPVMVSAIVIEHLCAGMSTAAFCAFFWTLCDKRYTASQYALLSSFMALTRVFISAPSGFLVKALGWPTYFLGCALLGVPGLLMLLLRFKKWSGPGTQLEAP